MSFLRDVASSPGCDGWCEARTQGAFVYLGRVAGATEDAASRRPAQPGGTGFIAEGAPITTALEVLAIVSAVVGAGVILLFFFGRWEE